MSIHVSAFRPSISCPETIANEEQLFFEKLSLLLDRRSEIVANKNYFFCPIPFAWCSILWVAGDGPLCLGYLLLGWNEGTLMEACPDCDSQVYVITFGGSPLSGQNGWSGYCLQCQSRKSGNVTAHKPFFNRVDFVRRMRQEYPASISSWEEHDGIKFSWGGDGTEPAKRTRVVRTSLAEPVDFSTLVQTLESNDPI